MILLQHIIFSSKIKEKKKIVYKTIIKEKKNSIQNNNYRKK